MRRSFSLAESVVALAVIAAGVVPLLIATATVARTQYAYRAGRVDEVGRANLLSYASWCEMRRVPLGQAWDGVPQGNVTRLPDGSVSVGAPFGSVGEFLLSAQAGS